MGKPLTPQLVIAKTKSDSLHLIQNLNLWGNEIDDLQLIRQMPNLEVVSLSVNKIQSLRDFSGAMKLQELYLRKNDLTNLAQIKYLIGLPNLKVLWLCDNECADTPNYREIVIQTLPNLIKLDNLNITPEQKSGAQKISQNVLDELFSTLEEENDETDGNYGSTPTPVPNAAPPSYSKKPSYNEENQKLENNYNSNNYPKSSIPSAPSRPSIAAPQSDLKQYQYSEPQNNSPPIDDDSRNQNIVIAILSLLQELNESGLELVKREVQQKQAYFRK